MDGSRDAQGRFNGLFARRRFRVHLADFGNSSYCESIPLAEVEPAASNFTALLAKVDYRGIFSAEFKRDARDGQFRILEVNTRAWTYVEFAARCGVNVCEMAWQDALERPVDAASPDYLVGAGCVNLQRDINAVRGQSRQAREPWLKILRQWARADYHTFRFDDPLPGLFSAWRIAPPPDRVPSRPERGTGAAAQLNPGGIYRSIANRRYILPDTVPSGTL